MRILVVEDNELVADAIAMGLSAAGFAVDRTANAPAAAAALASEHFDLAVVDVGLPGMDGLSLVRQIRAGGGDFAGHDPDGARYAGRKGGGAGPGADDFLMKPFEQAELIARCRALIRRANLNVSGQMSLGTVRIDISGRQLRINDAAGRADRTRVGDPRMSGPQCREGRFEGAVAAGDRRLGRVAHAECRRGVRVAGANQTRGGRDDPHGARTGIPPG